MVKNTHGGNKSKGFARKDAVKKSVGGLRVADNEGEIYAQAERVMGGSIVKAIDLDGRPLRAHIRGKFRGRGKRDNYIGQNTWLLVGLYSWGKETIDANEMRDCDILEVYNETDKIRLKNSVTSVNWTRFINNDTKTLGASESKEEEGGDITFMDDTAQEYEELINQKASKESTTIVLDDGEVIDVNDI